MKKLIGLTFINKKALAILLCSMLFSSLGYATTKVLNFSQLWDVALPFNPNAVGTVTSPTVLSDILETSQGGQTTSSIIGAESSISNDSSGTKEGYLYGYYGNGIDESGWGAASNLISYNNEWTTSYDASPDRNYIAAVIKAPNSAFTQKDKSKKGLTDVQSGVIDDIFIAQKVTNHFSHQSSYQWNNTAVPNVSERGCLADATQMVYNWNTSEPMSGAFTTLLELSPTSLNQAIGSSFDNIVDLSKLTGISQFQHLSCVNFSPDNDPNTPNQFNYGVLSGLDQNGILNYFIVNTHAIGYPASDSGSGYYVYAGTSLPWQSTFFNLSAATSSLSGTFSDPSNVNAYLASVQQTSTSPSYNLFTIWRMYQQNNSTNFTWDQLPLILTTSVAPTITPAANTLLTDSTVSTTNGTYYFTPHGYWVTQTLPNSDMIYSLPSTNVSSFVSPFDATSKISVYDVNNNSPYGSPLSPGTNLLLSYGSYTPPGGSAFFAWNVSAPLGMSQAANVTPSQIPSYVEPWGSNTITAVSASWNTDNSLHRATVSAEGPYNATTSKYNHNIYIYNPNAATNVNPFGSACSISTAADTVRQVFSENAGSGNYNIFAITDNDSFFQSFDARRQPLVDCGSLPWGGNNPFAYTILGFHFSTSVNINGNYNVYIWGMNNTTKCLDSWFYNGSSWVPEIVNGPLVCTPQGLFIVDAYVSWGNFGAYNGSLFTEYDTSPYDVSKYQFLYNISGSSSVCTFSNLPSGFNPDTIFSFAVSGSSISNLTMVQSGVTPSAYTFTGGRWVPDPTTTLATNTTVDIGNTVAPSVTMSAVSLDPNDSTRAIYLLSIANLGTISYEDYSTNSDGMYYNITNNFDSTATVASPILGYYFDPVRFSFIPRPVSFYISLPKMDLSYATSTNKETITITPTFNGITQPSKVNSITCTVPYYIDWTVPSQDSNLTISAYTDHAYAPPQNGVCALPTKICIYSNGAALPFTDPLYTHLIPLTEQFSGGTYHLAGCAPSDAFGVAMMPNTATDTPVLFDINHIDTVMYGIRPDPSKIPDFFTFIGPNAVSGEYPIVYVTGKIQTGVDPNGNPMWSNNPQTIAFTPHSSSITVTHGAVNVGITTVVITATDIKVETGAPSASPVSLSRIGNVGLSNNLYMLDYTFDYADQGSNSQFVYPVLPVGFGLYSQIPVLFSNFKVGFVPLPDASSSVDGNPLECKDYVLQSEVNRFGYTPGTGDADAIPTLQSNVTSNVSLFDLNNVLGAVVPPPTTTQIVGYVFDQYGEFGSCVFPLASSDNSYIEPKSNNFLHITINNKTAMENNPALYVPEWVSSMDSDPSGATSLGDRLGIPANTQSVGVFIPSNTNVTFYTTIDNDPNCYYTYSPLQNVILTSLNGGQANTYFNKYQIIFSILGNEFAENDLSTYESSDYNVVFKVTNNRLTTGIPNENGTTNTAEYTQDGVNILSVSESSGHSYLNQWTINQDKTRNAATDDPSPANFVSGLRAYYDSHSGALGTGDRWVDADSTFMEDTNYIPSPTSGVGIANIYADNMMASYHGSSTFFGHILYYKTN